MGEVGASCHAGVRPGRLSPGAHFHSMGQGGVCVQFQGRVAIRGGRGGGAQTSKEELSYSEGDWPSLRWSVRGQMANTGVRPIGDRVTCTLGTAGSSASSFGCSGVGRALDRGGARKWSESDRVFVGGRHRRRSGSARRIGAPKSCASVAVGSRSLLPSA